MKKGELKKNPLFFGMLGLLIASASTIIEDFTNIPSTTVLIVAMAIYSIPLFFWIKDWIKKKR